MSLGRAQVTLKIAASLDGRIALGSGESRWITGEAARADGHRLRARVDAVMVGSGAAVADDPALTVRLPGYDGRQPIRIVLDGRGRLSPQADLVRTAEAIATWVFARPDAVAGLSDRLDQTGVRVSAAPAGGRGEGVDPNAVLTTCSEAGVGSVLLEGGGQVAASFLSADCVDEIVWYVAPLVLGADARPALGPLGLEKLTAAPNFAITGVDRFDADTRFTLTRRSAS
ncbi:MAG: RibD family protein [Maricaulaceae bacterium]